METSISKAVPKTHLVIPKSILFLAEKLAPQYDRAIVLGDVRALECESRREYAWCAAKLIGGVIKARMWESFNIWLPIGEAVFLYLMVSVPSGDVPLLPFAVLLTLLISLLRVRDAYAYPDQGSPEEMIVDAGLSLTFVIVLEILFAFNAPRLALPILKAGLAAIGVLVVSYWRMISRREDPPNPRRRELKERLSAAWHMNVLFIAASIPLIFTNVAAVPGSHGRDSFLGFAPPMLMLAACRLRKQHFRSIWERPLISLQLDAAADLEIDELSYKRGLLWFRDRTSPFPADLVAEFLYFAVLAFPLVQAAGRWVSNDPLAAEVDWLQVGVNSGALFALALLWGHIKKMNRDLANAIQQYVEARRAKVA